MGDQARRPPSSTGQGQPSLPGAATLVASEPGPVRVIVGHGRGGLWVVRTRCGIGVGLAGVAACGGGDVLGWRLAGFGSDGQLPLVALAAS
jgi:hypothetical protein